MNRFLTIITLSTLALLTGCEKEKVKKESTKTFEANPDYWVFKVEETRSLKRNLFLQLSNQSSRIKTVELAIYIDDVFVLSAEIPNLRRGHHMEVFGLDVPEGIKKIRIEYKNDNIQAEEEFEMKGRKFIFATFSTPEGGAGSIEILESDKPFYISERMHIQSELSTPFALLTTR